MVLDVSRHLSDRKASYDELDVDYFGQQLCHRADSLGIKLKAIDMLDNEGFLICYQASQDRHHKFSAWTNDQLARRSGYDYATEMIGLREDQLWWYNIPSPLPKIIRQAGQNHTSALLFREPHIDGSLRKILYICSPIYGKARSGLGGIVISSAIVEGLPDQFFVRSNQLNKHCSLIMGAIFDNEIITYKEYEVLELINSGYSRQEISQTLAISIHTFDHRRKQLCKKLDCQSKRIPEVAVGSGLMLRATQQQAWTW